MTKLAQPLQPQIPSAALPPRAIPKSTRLYRALQLICCLIFPVMFRFRARGLDKVPSDQPALLLMNHLSFLDPAMACFSLIRPVSFMARDSLFRVPVLGWMIKNLHAFPVKRQAASSATIRDAISRLDEGHLVGLFPEGTRSENGEMGAIRPGFVALVRKKPVQVIPIAIAGSDRALPRGAKWIRWATIRMVVGEPFTIEEVARLSQKNCEKEFVAQLSQRLADSYAEAQQWQSGKPLCDLVIPLEDEPTTDRQPPAHQHADHNTGQRNN